MYKVHRLWVLYKPILGMCSTYFVLTGRGQVRDIVIVADSSSRVNWAALTAFIKQIVGVFNVSPKGTHFAFVTFADTSKIAFQFPSAGSEYNVQFVRQAIDGAQRSTGTGRNINMALQNTRRLLTQTELGSRPNARKVGQKLQIDVVIPLNDR